MYVKNPFGQDMSEINESNAGDRIGRRIKAIREEKMPKMTQGDLGALVGLTANRVQQYENGVRKPKIDLIKKFADALGVETSAILDPVVSSYIGAMYAFFEMEEQFGLRLKEIDGQIHICFGDRTAMFKDRTMNDNLNAWYEKQVEMYAALELAGSEEEHKKILHEYHMWERTFPNALADKTEKEIKKARLSRQVQELQEQIKKLDSGE